jgi:hypothetical protein
MSVGVGVDTHRTVWSVFYTVFAHLSPVFSVLGNVRE